MELLRGTIVSQYTVRSLIGRGGMAVVYLVEHNHLHTRHALKVLTTPTADVRARLLQEGRAQSRLRHPHVVSVTDTVELEGGLGLVMEYIEGPNLHELLKRRQLSLEQVDDLARGVLAGVVAAHEAGLVHRDLKPKNILLAVGDRGLVPKITDFGLAKALEGNDVAATRSGVSMGTPPYMAPEQIRDAKNADHRADVFSLGAVLYELVTNRRAFQGADVFETFVKINAGEYLAPRLIVPELPERMDRAIRGALVVDREARIQSCEELLARWTGVVQPDQTTTWDPRLLAEARGWTSEVDLEATTGVDETYATSVLPDQTGTLPPDASSGERLRHRGAARGRVGPVALGVGGLLVGAVALVGLSQALWPAEKPAASLPEHRFERITYQSTLMRHPSLSADGASVVYEEDGELFVRRLGGQRPFPITLGFEPAATTPALSPDGERVAAATDEGLFVMGATGESPRRLTDHGYHPAWSPDGSRLAYVTALTTDPLRPGDDAAASRLEVVSLGGEVTAIDTPEPALGVAWSPDGEQLAFFTPDHDVSVIDLDSGEVTPVAVGVAHDWSMRFHPTRPELWMLSDRDGATNVWAVPLDGGAPAAVTRAPLGDVRTLSLSADGERFLYDVAAGDTSDLWSAARIDGRCDTGCAVPEVRFQALTDDGSMARPELAPGGGRLVYEKDGSLYVRRTQGTNALKIASDAWQPAFSPDGERVLYATGGGVFVVGASGENQRRVTDAGHHPAWSSDGRGAVYSRGLALEWSSVIRSGPLEVVDLEGGEPRELVPDGLGPHWRPGGDRVAYWTSRRELRTVRGDGTDDRPVEAAAGADAWSPTWSPDGERLYWVGRRNGTTDVWMVRMDDQGRSTSEPVAVITGVDGEISDLSVAADGTSELLAFGVDRVRANLMGHTVSVGERTLSSEARALTRGSNRFVDPSLSPDGSRVAFASFGVDEHLFVANADGTGLRVILADEHRNRGPVWHPEDDRIAFYSDRSGRYEVWSVRSDGSDLKLHTEAAPSGSYEPSWAPDGRLAMIAEEGGPRIVHPDGTVEHPDDLRFSPRWSADGTWVAGPIEGFMSVARSDAWSRPTVLVAGATPRWAGDDQLLFRSYGALVWHDLSCGGAEPCTPTAGPRHRIYTPVAGETVGSFDVSRDGTVLVRVEERARTEPWLATLRGVDGA